MRFHPAGHELCNHYPHTQPSHTWQFGNCPLVPLMILALLSDVHILLSLSPPPISLGLGCTGLGRTGLGRTVLGRTVMGCIVLGRAGLGCTGLGCTGPGSAGLGCTVLLRGAFLFLFTLTSSGLSKAARTLGTVRSSNVSPMAISTLRAFAWHWSNSFKTCVLTAFSLRLEWVSAKLLRTVSFTNYNLFSTNVNHGQTGPAIALLVAFTLG